MNYWINGGIAILNFAIAFFFLGALKPGYVKGIVVGINAAAALWNLMLFIEKVVQL